MPYATNKMSTLPTLENCLFSLKKLEKVRDRGVSRSVRGIRVHSSFLQYPYLLEPLASDITLTHVRNNTTGLLRGSGTPAESHYAHFFDERTFTLGMKNKTLVRVRVARTGCGDNLRQADLPPIGEHESHASVEEFGL